MPQLDGEMRAALRAASQKKQNSVSLRTLLDFGAHPTDKTLMGASAFLHRELPVRLAHRAIELVVRQRESGCQLAVVRLVAALCKARGAKAR